MDDLFGVTELVKEKVTNDEEAHHKPTEIHETTATTKGADIKAEPVSVQHMENDDFVREVR